MKKWCHDKAKTKIEVRKKNHFVKANVWTFIFRETKNNLEIHLTSEPQQF